MRSILGYCSIDELTAVKFQFSIAMDWNAVNNILSKFYDY